MHSFYEPRKKVTMPEFLLYADNNLVAHFPEQPTVARVALNVGRTIGIAGLRLKDLVVRPWLREAAVDLLNGLDMVVDGVHFELKPAKK